MPVTDITATSDALMRQAPATVAEYLDHAVKAIDRQFGEGYAASNPALVGAFLQAASMDFAGTIIAQQIREGMENAGASVARVLGDVAENVRTDHPLMGGTVEDLSAAIRAAGEAVAAGLKGGAA